MYRIMTAVLLICCFNAVSLGHELTLSDSSLPPEKVAELLDLNEATAEQLDELPEIGPALAERIVAYRDQQGPFIRIEQLDEVKGVGPRILEKLRPLVTVR
jgi:competence protein ComEA